MSSEPSESERTQVVTTAMAAVPQGFEPRDHFLVLFEGATPGLRVKLPEKPVCIGRHPSCDVAIADPRLSGRHCELALQSMKSSVLVRDLGSTNGTFIEGERVDGAAPLLPGQLLRVGDQLFRHDHLTRSEAEKSDTRQKDLERAKHYVESLLPAPIAAGPVRTDWCYVPSADLGGDAFGYHQLGEDTFCGYLIDVSGHGVGAAMHSVSVLNVMRQRALPGCDFADPSQVLRSLNDMFQMEAHDGMYFSIWYGVWDLRSRLLRYASGGHHAAYLLSADRGTMDALKTRNLVIGAAPGRSFEAAQAEVADGSTLYVFSDGVFEVETPGGEQLALRHFLPVLQESPGPMGHDARRVYDRVRERARPGPLDDDFTLLAVTFLSS